jgi:membrane fusion protein, multidrug efflux system
MTDAPNTLPDTDPADQINDQALKAKRKKSLGFVAVILIIAAILFLIWKLFFNHSVSTDNAYVGAETENGRISINETVKNLIFIFFPFFK